MSRPVGSAKLKLPDSTSNNQLAGSKHDDFDQIVKATPRFRRSITGAVENTGCYSYLNQKNGCAYANPTNNCARKMSSIAVRLFAMSPQASNSSDTNQSSASTEKTLSKRSENQTSWAPAPMNTTSLLATLNSSVASNSSSTTSGSKSIPPSELSESNICGDYDGEEQMGVCLWSGPSSDSQYGNESGWVSSDIKRNCHKEVILQRTGSASPLIVARVLEGCNFNTADLSIGCSQIYVTKKVFMALNPNPSELEQGALQDPITWDFVIVEDFPWDLEVRILACSYIALETPFASHQSFLEGHHEHLTRFSSLAGKMREAGQAKVAVTCYSVTNFKNPLANDCTDNIILAMLRWPSELPGGAPRTFNTLLKPCGKDARSRRGESSRCVIFGDKL
ncbi:hypothetical protein H4Q26_015139 [Puccinia striiformis f. sp. tritici PST-130]|nr:hypothetical protein H4Q26_015139 [Puccinia striiformis f. sp. tritici PST-130]